jgi:ubiquinone/menaquinone biosynthesis C-methylase UbiE
MRVDYDNISAIYDGARSVNAELAETIMREAGLVSGARVLDLGCGTGNIEAALAETVDLKVVGVDRSLGMLGKARSKIPGASWVQADCANLPLQDKAFDCALMLYMVHYLTDFRSVVEGVHHVLRSGKLVILTASHEQIENSFMSGFFPNLAPIDKARFPAVDSILEALLAVGFSDVKSRAIPVAKVTRDESYLRKVESKHVSTFHLISDEEFRLGLEKMRQYICEHEGDPPLDHMGTLISAEKI